MESASSPDPFPATRPPAPLQTVSPNPVRNFLLRRFRRHAGWHRHAEDRNHHLDRDRIGPVLHFESNRWLLIGMQARLHGYINGWFAAIAAQTSRPFGLRGPAPADEGARGVESRMLNRVCATITGQLLCNVSMMFVGDAHSTTRPTIGKGWICEARCVRCI
ncbi:uncharacterized protein BDW43DRAFT_307439 [Aspergillus alliaceus]|uniref:uncharacterized protein n=1 Tax=Petromyces alliaceus TaxID=209559 RepID=UPI0012A3E690|nr:uncharacterized protein BDW43DRAFT_307439 [Aspergillus alliaceus]KAB8237158.1 hypothetical protein BDW43DRAFT_307439 [Aspergillus alliaceus]